MFYHIFLLPPKRSFCSLLLSSSPFGSLQIPIQCFFSMLLQNVTDPPSFSRSSLSYRLLSGSFPQLSTTNYLRPSYVHYSLQPSVNKLFNLPAIWVVSFHVSHPFSSTDLTLLLNIRILVIVNLFLFFHIWYICTKILFAFLICA